MGYYKTDIVKADDTLQTIMFRNFKSVDGWHDKLAVLNDLQYPYIVATDKEKMKNPNHLMSPGDKIKLPILNEFEKLAIDQLSHYALDDVYDTVMGSDLEVQLKQSQGYDENSAEILGDSHDYDLANVAGIQNLKQSLFLRIMTRKGTLLLHPEYGSTLPVIIGDLITKDTLDDAEVELKRVITTDTRVQSVSIIGAKLTGQEVFIAVKVTPIGAQKAFELFLYQAENGQFFLK